MVHFYSTYSVPGPVLSTLDRFIPLILAIALVSHYEKLPNA